MWRRWASAGQPHSGVATEAVLAAKGDTEASSPAGLAEVGLEVGSHVWISGGDEVWRGGVVTGLEKSGTAEGGSISIQVSGADGSSEKQVVPLVSKATGGPQQWLPRSTELLDAAGAVAAHDLGALTLLHEPELLHALQARFQRDAVYTHTGPMLLALNPFRAIPALYDEVQLARFMDLPAGEPAPLPHVYGVARNAYQGVWRAAASQSVLISGESGAGKTETTKFVMRFLALAGAGGAEGSMSVVERRVLEAIPLLEALGNAKTLRNHNSSRFGKYTELQFRRTLESHCAGARLESEDDPRRPVHGPRLAGARTHCYLLEKVRVTGVQKGERSFHIFYQLLAAASRSYQDSKLETPAVQRRAPPPGVSAVLGLVAHCSPSDFSYLSASPSEGLASHDEAAAFDLTLAAMQAFGISDEDAGDFVAAVLAVLQLGNIAFRAPANNSEGSEVVDRGDETGPLATASKLLGVEAKSLEAAFCSRLMRVKDERSEQKITQIRNTTQATEGRDALARHLYGVVFGFAVASVNNVLGVARNSKDTEPPHLEGLHHGKSLPFIGVLDIFGFEFFESNSFEQLCINFANELLQQYFNEAIFEHEAALYASERVPWDPLDFPDNRAVVELIVGDGRPPLSGLLPMLDEECNVTGGSADAWSRKLAARYAPGGLLKPVKRRQGHFVVQHFAGPVEYGPAAFLVKNKDTLSLDVVECMQSSSKELVKRRFLEHSRIYGAQTAVSSGRVTRAKTHSVSSDFRQQLKTLMEGIRSTSPHFVRCIKPNPDCAAGAFHRRTVVEQLRYQGVLEAIRVSRVGYPVRQRHREAVLDFRWLAPREIWRRLEVDVGRGAFAEAAMLLFTHLKTALPGIPSTGLQIGLRQIFQTRETAQALAVALRRTRSLAAVVIQAAWRREMALRQFSAARSAALRLQSAARAAAARARARTLRRERAARLLQRAERGHRARVTYSAALRAVRLLQGWIRVRHQRFRFLQASSLAVRLQRWFRRVLPAVQERRHQRAVHCIQRHWRGSLGRREAWRQLAARRRLDSACQKLLARWRRHTLERVRDRIGGGRRRRPKASNFPSVAGESRAARMQWWSVETSSSESSAESEPGAPQEAKMVYTAPTAGEMHAASASLRLTNSDLTAEGARLMGMCHRLQIQLHDLEEESYFYKLTQLYTNCCHVRTHTHTDKPPVPERRRRRGCAAPSA
mmetsp:Transcript_26547/g.76430  ORF Transcript_26547/g.76430 Transcript_26547/m.76430 type:complete len:1199 (-) Transcript_26547:131-3727(-)